MGEALIIDSVSYYTSPYIIVNYQDSEGVAAASDSTSLIELSLPGLYTTEESYRHEPRRMLTSKSYVIKLFRIAISCLSANYTFRILNRNDILLINSIYKVYTSGAINLGDNISLTELIIRNRDVVLDNKIYLFISNLGIDTGPIDIDLTFQSLQDREF